MTLKRRSKEISETHVEAALCEAGAVSIWSSSRSFRRSATVLCALLLPGMFSLRAGEPLFETTVVFPITPNNKPNYRIPAIIQAPNGDLLIIAEKRNDGPGDVGNTDIVLKRSRDLGKTWSDEQMIFDDEKRVCTDLTVGLDRSNGKLWLFFLRDKKQFDYFTSIDSGATWQGPVSVHEQVTKPEWDALKGKAEPEGEGEPKGRMAIWEKGWAQRYGCGPGNAIVQLKSGRLVVPARHREDIGKGRLRSFAHCFYSDDHGATWKLGGTIGINTSECQFVELANGSLMVMSRNESAEDAPDNLRHLCAISSDGGENWSFVRRVEELITPRCHGPIERYSLATSGDKDRLLFSSPASPFRQKEHPYGRYNLTVRLSCDEGATWTAGKTIWPHPASYSDMVVLPDHTVAIVYERGDKGTANYWDALHFARFNLEWLTDGRDSPDAAGRRARSVRADVMDGVLKELERLKTEAAREPGPEMIRPSEVIAFHLLADLAANGAPVELTADEEKLFDMIRRGGSERKVMELSPGARIAMTDDWIQDKSGSYLLRTATLFILRDGKWVKAGSGATTKSDP